MSKLSDAVKALINASHAAPGITKASPQVQPALKRFAEDAHKKQIGLPSWVSVSTAVSATMNCPDAMTSIFHLANEKSDNPHSSTKNAELIREVGLKCISFNGIPRSINCLGAFHASLPDDGGLALWDSVYTGFERKLLAKLGASHPDLPVHILNGHYANLLSNPPRDEVLADPYGRDHVAVVGRVLTSLVAIACLRAQTGVGPQVVSHIFGLRKAYEQGDAHAAGEEEVQGGVWLASDEAACGCWSTSIGSWRR
ncbi:aldehyde dehydrogenase [Apiospora arundinis]